MWPTSTTANQQVVVVSILLMYAVVIGAKFRVEKFYRITGVGVFSFNRPTRK